MQHAQPPGGFASAAAPRGPVPRHGAVAAGAVNPAFGQQGFKICCVPGCSEHTMYQPDPGNPNPSLRNGNSHCQTCYLQLPECRTPECTKRVVPPPKGWRAGDDHTLCVHCRRALERQGGGGYGGYGGGRRGGWRR